MKAAIKKEAATTHKATAFLLKRMKLMKRINRMLIDLLTLNGLKTLNENLACRRPKIKGLLQAKRSKQEASMAYGNVIDSIRQAIQLSRGDSVAT